MREDGEPGRWELPDGSRIPPETARRLTCDAALVPVEKNEEGEILNIGRRRRTFPPAIRRALEVLEEAHAQGDDEGGGSLGGQDGGA